MVPFASPGDHRRGQWSPVGRRVGGVPAVYVTTLRPDPIHTSYVVGVAWMDTKLLRATLYSGSQIPGGGPYTDTAPIAPTAATSLVAAFNAGFLMSNANGGYYNRRTHRSSAPFRCRVVRRVRQRQLHRRRVGRDVTMTPSVAAVRQNLDLLVDNGQPVAGLNASDTTQWGATLGNQVYVWRSGLGVTADGALVYVGDRASTSPTSPISWRGQGRAGDGVGHQHRLGEFRVVSTDDASGAATAANGTDLLPNMIGTPVRYFEPYWARDFITMSRHLHRDTAEERGEAIGDTRRARRLR